MAKVLKGGASMPPGMKVPGTHNSASVPFAAWDDREWGCKMVAQAQPHPLGSMVR